MKLFDKVQIEMKTAFGAVSVEFTIIAEINMQDRVYGLIAQNRLVVGQQVDNNKWKLSSPIDLMDVPILDTLYLDTTKEVYF